MARLPRLTLAGQPHHLLQHGHNARPIVLDDADRRRWHELLHDAAVTHRVDVHAWVLLDDHFHLLATPREEGGLSRLMQTFGRRYVGAFNRRHGCSGTLWDGRFRAALLEPQAWLLDGMRYIEQHPVRSGLCEDPQAWPWSSLAHHLGHRRDVLVSEAPAFWRLGNTPFEREAAWLALIAQPLATGRVDEITRATRRGWPLASTDFLRALQPEGEALRARRPRGRPRKLSGS